VVFSLPGFCVPAYNQIRKYVFVETVKSWSEAQSYCREKHTDLATVHSQEEAQQLLTVKGASLWDSWIGLYRDDTQNWQWSNSDDVIYSNWRADVFCAAVNSDGKWTDLPCKLQKAFMCYKGGREQQVLSQRLQVQQWAQCWGQQSLWLHRC
ncbi:snaclec coagulation factor IX/factor X-binding protein subunit B3-like, partial [Huso huso]